VVRAAEAPPAGWSIGLRGAHQAANAACALAAIDALERSTALRVPVAARRRGLTDARWPGRLEELPGPPRVWLDAAHNPNGAEALARALRGERPGRLVVVCGASADKDVGALLAPVIGLADVVVCAQGPSDRAMPAAAVGAVASRLPGPPARQIFVEPELPAALARARQAAGRAGDLVVVFGSIFLVGGARALLTGEPVDPVVTQEPAATLR
jgi:dihydrofolate synthase / folylpolyglutamate synthase